MSGTFYRLRTAYRRRVELRERFNISNPSEDVEESCVVSYSHWNPLVAYAAWMRLMVALRLWRRHVSPGAVLDFGSGTGEISHFLGSNHPYHFIESAEALSDALGTFVPGARRERLDSLPEGAFSCIFALDSLEHNEDVGGIVERLAKGMASGGVLIVSGPTENALYRLARAIARFRGGYFHKTTIYDIESVLAERFTRLEVHGVPFGLPLFRVSAWRFRAESRSGPS